MLKALLCLLGSGFLLGWSSDVAASFILPPINSMPVQVDGLSGTGLNGSVHLPARTIDPHYELVAAPYALANENAYVLPGIGPGWSSTDASEAQWIGQDPELLFAPPSGLYVYRLELDLTGIDTEYLNIWGWWMMDDWGDIYVNGILTNTHVAPGGFGSRHYFLLANDFQPGVNTIDFHVVNDGFYTGVVVSNVVALVPEASTLTLMSASLLGFATIAFRRRWLMSRVN